MAKSKNSSQKINEPLERLALNHLFIGWLGLLTFLSLGILLEVFHGLKLDLYLDVRQETRRFMWTLAHAHGTLFSLVHIAFSWSVSYSSRWTDHAKDFRLSSKSLTAGLILMPLGFFLGGVWTFAGDPGWGIFLVPVGAILMMLGCGKTMLLFARFRRRIP